MPGPRFVVEVTGGVPVVKTPQEIDVTNAAGLRSALLAAAGNGHKRFVVDMTRTRYCDASASHVLAAAHRRALDEGRQMLLAVSNALVLRVFALTGIDRMIPSFASLD
ncbi:MAG TPA: STAS domain-containing protein, partial [Trebonia sp.]|nr:STAS domain-containing protein [Trebonia sp.]